MTPRKTKAGQELIAGMKEKYMKNKDTKFKKGDKVKVIHGFNRGLVGEVYWYSSTVKCYNIRGVEGSYHEDDLELYTPGWKRLFICECDLAY
jgi:hypothetical protein